MRNLAPATLVLLALLFLTPGIGGKNSPGQGDEVMHLLTVQSSVEAKSYLIPVIDGQPNYYKPPLLFWAGMLTESIFGQGLLGGRISSVFFTVLTALLIYCLLLYVRIDWRVAFFAAIAYLLTVGVMKFARLLMMEQGMAFALTAIAICLAAQMRTGRLRYALYTGLITGFAFLFKGPLFIVYTGLLYSVWAAVLLYRFRTEQGKLRWTGRSDIARISKTAALVLGGSLVVPLVWAAMILGYAGKEGAVLLQFFFVVENLGKFAQDNQNGLRLLTGWLVYTFPWTIIVLAGMFAVFRDQSLSRKSWPGRVFILAVFVIMVFHILPNRKAAYYGIPFLPLVFAGIPLILKNLVDLERSARWTIVLLYVVSPVLAAAAVLGSQSWAGILILIPAMAALSLERLAVSGRLKEFFACGRSMKIAGISGSLLVLVLQFVMYPLLSHEILPQDRVAAFSKRMCVVTGETWDGMDLEVLRPDLEIVVTVPMSPDTCVDGQRGVLYIPDSPREESMIDGALEKHRYAEKARWSMWSRRLDTDAVVDYLQDGRRLLSRVRYYEPAQ